MRAAYYLHMREQLIAKAHNPPRERAEIVARLRINGHHADADALVKNTGAETRGRFAA
ncbi:hypothetical protein GCM10007874_60040 [Labrys miyagiensis]|uniref:Transposase n=1 Tax=Labrys miyagiensis TaxID=346912 RepID=A0ABQ6CTC8_9HYPH|nr:hypothetical protein GCM10007874_60040 [Labrys miyagiensis]